MKKLITLLVLTLFAAVPANAELLINGDFEDAATGWDQIGRYSHTTTIYYAGLAPVPSGEFYFHSVGFPLTGSTTTTATQTVDVTGLDSGSFVFSADIAGYQDGGDTPIIEIEFYDAAGGALGGGNSLGITATLDGRTGGADGITNTFDAYAEHRVIPTGAISADVRILQATAGSSNGNDNYCDNLSLIAPDPNNYVIVNNAVPYAYNNDITVSHNNSLSGRAAFYPTGTGPVNCVASGAATYTSAMTTSATTVNGAILNPALVGGTYDVYWIDPVTECSLGDNFITIVILPAPGVAEGNLMGHWTFDTTLADSSGRVDLAAGALDGDYHYDENGANPDPTYVTGVIGQAIELTNSSENTDPNFSQYVVLGDNPENLTYALFNYSVQFWFKSTDGVDPTETAIVSNKDWNAGGNIGWVIGTDGAGDWEWNFADSSGRSDYDPDDTNLENTQWHLITVTHERGGNAIMYFDGKETATVDLSGHANVVDSGLPTVVGTGGALGVNFPAFLNGAVDDLRIYSGVYTREEVATAWYDITGVNICYETIVGDLNGDCEVNMIDLSLLAADWLDCMALPTVEVCN